MNLQLNKGNTMLKRESLEEKLADRIGKLINDLTIDLEQLGMYFARSNSTTYRRLIEIAESAKYEKEEKNDYHP
jgi:ribosomal protein L16 Arg81 hydroxylase